MDEEQDDPRDFEPYDLHDAVELAEAAGCLCSELWAAERCGCGEFRGRLSGSGLVVIQHDPRCPAALTAEMKEWLPADGNPTSRAEHLSDRHERLHNRDGKVEGVDR